MKHAFISPFTNETNEYIELQKLILIECGFNVYPLNIRTLLSKKISYIFKKETVLLYHWIENRAFKNRGASKKLNYSGLLQWVVYLLLNIATPAKSVYFIHNHAAHDTTGLLKRFSEFLIYTFSRTTSIRVVHDPAACQIYNAKYLPHPIYWDSPLATERTKLNTGTSATRTFGIIGAIRPYKKIDQILRAWPRDQKLIIRGKGDDTYIHELAEIIRNSNLGSSVDLKNAFLSKQDFDSTLKGLDGIILPHENGSMLVSGAFFEAIGLTPFIIARRTRFFQHVSNIFKSVHLFETQSELQEIIKEISKGLIQSNSMDQESLAIREFGWRHCVNCYQNAFTA